MKRHVLDNILLRHGPLLGVLIKNCPITRMQLVQLTKSSQTTVTRWTAELLKSGITKESGLDRTSEPGRPSTFLELVPRRLLIGAIYIGRKEIEVGIVDLCGQIVSNKTLQVPECEWEHLGNTLVEAVNQISQILVDLDRGWDSLVGIGVAAQALVDTSRGIIIRDSIDSNNHITISTPVIEILTEHLPDYLHVAIETNALAMTLGEYWFGCKADDFLLMYAGRGVGSGLMLDGKLYRGKGVVGEISHVPSGQYSAQCYCGNRGCLEAVVGASNIIKHLAEDRRFTSIKEVVDAALDGCEPAHLALIEASKAVATVAGGIIDALGLSTVVLAGDIFKYPQSLTYITEHINKWSFMGHYQGKITILPATISDIKLVGASSIVIDYLATSMRKDPYAVCGG